MFSDVTWDVSVLLITRALSLEFDHLVSAFFPAYIAFPSYTNGTSRLSLSLLHTFVRSLSHGCALAH